MAKTSNNHTYGTKSSLLRKRRFVWSGRIGVSVKLKKILLLTALEKLSRKNVSGKLRKQYRGFSMIHIRGNRKSLGRGAKLLLNSNGILRKRFFVKRPRLRGSDSRARLRGSDSRARRKISVLERPFQLGPDLRDRGICTTLAKGRITSLNRYFLMGPHRGATGRFATSERPFLMGSLDCSDDNMTFEILCSDEV